MDSRVTQPTSDRLVPFTHYFLYSVSFVAEEEVASSSSRVISEGMGVGFSPLVAGTQQKPLV